MSTRSGLLGVVLACAAAAFSSSAHAQAIRFISTLGSDGNPCTLALPCRTLQVGIGSTPIGGELRILDSGVYGATGTIVKSITIDGNGNTVLMNGGVAITINNAAAVVTLRELILNGRGAAHIGILIRAAAATHIAGCEVENFSVNGPSSTGIVSEAAGEALFISGTTSSNNGTGILLQGGAGSIAHLDRVRIIDNIGDGLLVRDTELSVTRSLIAGNPSYGIFQYVSGRAMVTATVLSGNGHGLNNSDGEVNLENCVIRGHSLGLIVGNLARISNSVVTDNNVGIRNHGIVETRGNNTVAGNSTNIQNSGTLVTLGGL